MELVAKYQWLSACNGLELYILPDNSYSGRICSVSLDKNLLSVDKKLEEQGSLQHILKKLSKENPLALTLTGKGVLIKKTSRIEEINQSNLNQVFPNLSLEDFYIQNFISGEYSFVALVRKEVVDQLVETIVSSGYRLLLISLGPFALSHVLDHINTYGNEIRFDGNQVQYNKDYQWEDYKYVPGLTSDFPLKIDTEQLPEKAVLSYATAFQLALFNRLNPVNIHTDETDRALTEFREEKKFKFRLSVLLAAFFLILLANFLLFSWYSSKNETLLAVANQSSTSMESMKNIERELNTKEKLLADLGWNKGMSFAFLSDQIGQTVPASITLDELEINPVQAGNINPGKETYDKGQIRISGKTINLQAVNDWIYAIKEKNWVKQVILESYTPDTDEEDNRQQFTLRISI